ncbi:MAG TPA: zinc-binding dehydrogenase [Acidimicrobiales bacterium]|nr:zinc-binding dehydrogenase [Acidimicrobiales bacterium]
MRALVYNPDAPQGLELGEVPEPEARPSEALIGVAAVSLNFADVAFLRNRLAPGAVPGFDASGVVLVAATDGSGPPAGTRVVTFGWSGAWAEQRAVEPAELAVVPDTVELEVAAAIPVAGVTALRALRQLGSLVGRRVLITGASGGVGRFAVQLAARAGAHVVASVGSPDRAEGLSALGAAEVVVGVDGISEPVYGALDNVGGRTLADVYALLEPGGSVQSVGIASLEPTTIDFEEARLRGGDTRIEAFAVGPGFGPDLEFLVGLVAAGELDAQIGWRGSWEKAADAAAALLGRQVRGKAVLEVSP